MLDPVNHVSIRLPTSAFPTSLVESLYVDSNKWSPHLKRSCMSFVYYLKVPTDKESPLPYTIGDLSSSVLFDHHPLLQPYTVRGA